MKVVTDPVLIDKRKRSYRRKRLIVTVFRNIGLRIKSRWNGIIYTERSIQTDEYDTWFDTVNTKKSKAWISCYNCHKRTKDRNIYVGMFLCTPCLTKLSNKTPNIEGFLHRGRRYHKKPSRRDIATKFASVKNELQEAQ
jgi:hypothetical protein